MDNGGDDSIYVYLSNLGNKIEYPKNTASSFTNLIKPPLRLSEDYSVGLKNIFFKQEFYSVKYNDSAYSIRISIVYREGGNTKGGESVKYTPTTSFTSNDINHLVASINNDLRTFLVKNRFISPTQGAIFFVHQMSGFVIFDNLLILNPTNFPTDDVVIKWEFSKQIADVLGVAHGETTRPRAVKLPSLPGKLSKAIVYTDIVKTSRHGIQEVSILDILPVSNIYSKNSTDVIYKKLKMNYIDEISIIMKDEFNNLIPFTDDVNVTAILHFKKGD